MVPFFGAPELTIPLYFGLACFVGLFVPEATANTDEDDTIGTIVLKGFIKVTVQRAILLLIAWIAVLCV